MPSRLRYAEFAPEGVATMRTTEHYLNATTALPAVLLELVRLRVSLQNGCDFCIGHHTNELRKHNEPETRIAALRDWQNAVAFTPKERAALAWADSVTDIQTRHADDIDYAGIALFFHEKDLVDLTLAIASINAWNRLSIAFREAWDPNRASKPLSPEVEGTPQPAAEASTVSTAQSHSSPTPAHDDAPTQDVVDDDGGKVAHDG